MNKPHVTLELHLVSEQALHSRRELIEHDINLKYRVHRRPYLEQFFTSSSYLVKGLALLEVGGSEGSQRRHEPERCQLD